MGVVVPIVELLGHLFPALTRIRGLPEGAIARRPPVEGVLEDEIAEAGLSRRRRHAAPCAAPVKRRQSHLGAVQTERDSEHPGSRYESHVGLHQRFSDAVQHSPFARWHRQRVGLPAEPSIDARINRGLVWRHSSAPSLSRMAEREIGESTFPRKFPGWRLW